MQFSCESCKAQLQIADEKVKGKRLIVRCRRCGAKIAIADPSLSNAPPRLVQPPAPAAPAPMRVAPLPQAPPAPAAPARREAEVEEARARKSEAKEAAKADEPIQNGASSRPPPPPAAPADAPTWFAMLHGKQTGPLTRAEVVGKTDEAEIGPRTYLWKEGMSAWQRAKDVPELAGLFPQPPGPSLPPPLPIASSAPPPPPRPQAESRKTSSFDRDPRKPATDSAPRRSEPELRKPMAAGVPAGEAPVKKAKADHFAIDANLAQPARPPDGAAPAEATQKKAAELARWASEELARMPSAPERPSQEALPSMFERAAPVRKNGTFLVFVVLAILAAAALAMWIGFSDREKTPPATGEKSENAPPPLDPAAAPAAEARGEPPAESRAPEYKPAAPAAGLTPAQVRSRLDESKGALQGCIDDALRREPELRVGRIHIATTIAPSGQVTSAKIDRRAVDESALGACLKRATRRIAFPEFGGDAFDVDIPIAVTAGE